MVTLIDDLKRHEGFRAKPYRCTAGKLTIGYGLNLDAGISEAEATSLLITRCIAISGKLQKSLPFWRNLSQNRRDVLINMAYNIGIDGLFGFTLMINHLHTGDYKLAAKEMLDSRWAVQVGDRAVYLANIMETG